MDLLTKPCDDCDGEGWQEVYDFPRGHPAHHPAWTHKVGCITCAGSGRVERDDDMNEEEEAV